MTAQEVRSPVCPLPDTGNLEFKETTTIQVSSEMEPMLHNMQIRKWKPPVHWLVAGVTSQRPSPNVATSAVGKFLDKLKSFYLCVGLGAGRGLTFFFFFF